MLSMARLIATSAASLALASAAPTALHTPAAPNPESGYAPVNGLKLYYEIRGTGAPVVVLHGGLSNTELIEGMIANLARTQRVIAVDLQGHGRTADIDRPFSCEAMADDIAAANGKATDLDEEQKNLLLQIPNLPNESVPEGVDASANRVRILAGDKVLVEMTPYDLFKGRITCQFK